jgi:hypothetical protein
MLKYILLATSVVIASPAFAQDAPASDKTMTPQQAPGPEQAAPPPAESQPTEAAQPATAQTAPTPETQPATAAAQPTPAERAQPATAPAAPAPAQPAADASQVAQVVGQEFPTYDKDASGALDKTEFSTWLVALRKASDASFQSESADAKTWLTQAFTQADIDKNATVTQTELTTFLSPRPKPA